MDAADVDVVDEWMGIDRSMMGWGLSRGGEFADLELGEARVVDELSQRVRGYPAV